MFKDSEKFFLNEQGKICYKKLDSTYLFALKNGIDLDTRFYMENKLFYIIEKEKNIDKEKIIKSNYKIYEHDSDFDYECNFNIYKKRNKLNKKNYKQVSRNRKYIKKIISKKRNNARKNKINEFIYNMDESDETIYISDSEYNYDYYDYYDYYNSYEIFYNTYWKYPLSIISEDTYSYLLI